MTRLVLLSEPSHVRKLLSRIRPDDRIVALRPRVAAALQARGIVRFVSPSLPAKSEDRALAWMKQWPRSSYGRTNFIRLMEHDNFSFWWLMESWLYYSSPYAYPLRDTLLAIETLSHLFASEKPDTILFVDDHTLYPEAIKELASHAHIPTTAVYSPLRVFFTRGRQRLTTVAIAGYFSLGSALRRFCWQLRKRRVKRAAPKGKIIFFSTYAWERVRDNGSTRIRDPFTEPVITELRSRSQHPILSIHVPVGSLLGLKDILRRAPRSDFTILEAYASPRTAQEARRATRYFRNLWKTLRNDRVFRDTFRYRGVPIFALAEKQFSSYFSTRLPGHCRDYYLLRAMLEREQPAIAVYPGETSEFAKSLFHLCRERRIPSIGMQHGALHKYLGWIHEPGEVSTNNCSPGICPIPDITTVYGPAYRRTLLAEGHYPPSSIFVAGAQRFDRAINDRERFDRNAFLKTVGIPPDARIVTYLTSPLEKCDATAMTEAVMNAVKTLPHTRLIIKLHPNETASLYSSVSKAAGVSPTILRDVDLYDVLHATDVAVTHLSTAAIEAMIFDKPVVIINLTGRPDRMPYVHEGAATGVYRTEDLRPTLQKMFAGKDRHKKQRQAKRFLHDVAYKMDGKASARIAGLIENMVKKNTTRRQ